MTSYTITQGETWDGDDERRWTHFVRTDSGELAVKYFDDRDIAHSSTDSHSVVSTACDKLGLPGPDWVDHDGEHIHFGYGKPDPE